jgi:hypothetical protein
MYRKSGKLSDIFHLDIRRNSAHRARRKFSSESHYGYRTSDSSIQVRRVICYDFIKVWCMKVLQQIPDSSNHQQAKIASMTPYTNFIVRLEKKEYFVMHFVKYNLKPLLSRTVISPF